MSVNRRSSMLIVHLLFCEGFVNMIGGCCGTTPSHIRSISAVVSTIPPRVIPDRVRTLRLSGLEPLVFTPNLNFVNIGERCNVTGSKRFANLIKDNKYEVGISMD